MVVQQLVNLPTLIEGLRILGVVGYGLVEALKTLLILLELLESESHVKVDRCIVSHVQIVKLKTLPELVNGGLELLLLKELARLVL
jgi:hypothetical protein